ncbi:MAG: hypothetical protein WD275_09080, partial [Rhodothermales bacterium]
GHRRPCRLFNSPFILPIRQLFELPAIGDYGELQHVTDEEADYAVTVAERFVTAVRSVLTAVL